MSALLEILLEPVARLLLMVATWIVATPFILLGAFLYGDPYWDNVRAGYSAITRFWFR